MAFTLPKKNLSTRARSKKSEQRAAALIGGKLQPNSGAIQNAHLKGDVKSKVFLLENKTSNNASHSFTLHDWRKLKAQAFKQGRRPLFRMELQGESLLVLDERTFIDLLNHEL